ncbi:TetR/AcrR family transcriptional regulator [Cellulomonas sp. HZM]|uniref:TetR/AcrR family transcriptional regulator n=1 Tax=Cellulomonas sp. HZM TaxID=1454010 RepID=UPI000493572D|nr:TetR/AcrR family transcriptional regulator [Cellulomonas sp. HZM]
MARWEPGTSDRLRAAALDLFVEQGFEQTTSAEIAHAAGVTERTFFRHFRDKREVLFGGQDQLELAFVTGIRDAPAGAPPLDLVAAALDSAAQFFTDERRASSRVRQTVVDANPALQERERHKLASVAAVLRTELHAHGVPEPAARLAAESGATVFSISFAQWIAPGEERGMREIADGVLGALVSLTGAGAAEMEA